jgi:hypothetical protein
LNLGIPDNSPDLHASLMEMETEIAGSPKDYARARTALRQWLFSQINEEENGRSIADALSEINKGQAERAVGVVLIRCLAVDGLLPRSNAVNQIDRLVVEICESAVPDICTFVGVLPKSQTYEKLAVLSRGHQRICKLLQPVIDDYGDLQALCNARKTVLGALGHSVVRAYGNPFRLVDFRNATESLFSRLSRIVSLEPSFLQDFEECRRAIEDFKRVNWEQPTFLSPLFETLLRTTLRLLDAFLSSVRSKYYAKIRKGWGSETDLPKRYPLHEAGREFHIVIPLRNEGTGLAMDVDVTAVTSADDVIVSNQSIHLGSVKPGDFSVILDAMVAAPTAGFNGLLQVEWSEIGNPERLNADFEFGVKAQNSNIDWPALEYWTPYSTSVAEGESFIGRSDLVKSLASKLLRAPMEPYYITGQKRVGKTSLALAALQFAKANDPKQSINFHYILWGDVAHSDPASCIRLLGENIERFMIRELPGELTFERGNYQGSLSPLVSLSETAARATPEKKFVLVIDEFDEIPQELFLQGNLAETFFANLRSISRRKNMCLVLVGGENMPFIMDRQGQKLNNFSRINLSYFSRTDEWRDFQQMVRKPTTSVLNWHDDAVSEIFNISNGNPYFAKIVCAGVLRAAISQRDTDITADEVKGAIGTEISSLGSNSFAHLWQDGIPRPAQEREPDILRRSRVLVAAARCGRHSVALTMPEIIAHRATTALTETEVAAVLHDFEHRNVLREVNGVYHFVLPIFGMWIVDVGAQQLIADTLNEELANSVLSEENQAAVKSEEIVTLARSWPTYRGRQIGTDDIRAWYQQVQSQREQRILFTLLKRTRVFSETNIRERLREAFAILRPSLPVPITRSLQDRRSDVVITYVDGEGKSGSAYASLYAEENKIQAINIFSMKSFREGLELRRSTGVQTSVIVIIDDMAGTGGSLSGNITEFIDQNRELVDEIKVRVLTIVATQTAQRAILQCLSNLRHSDIDFRTCELLPSQHFAFPDDQIGFSSPEERERAKAICINLGSKIDKKRPLGFGGLGLLVVFPTNVPNNTLPILRSHSRPGSGGDWKPLFERISH